MNRISTLLMGFSFCLLTSLAHAQTAIDPEEIFTKACERVYEAKTYRYTGTFFAETDINYGSASKQKLPAKAKMNLKKFQKEWGKRYRIMGEITGAQSDDNTRFELANIRIAGTGTRKKPESLMGRGIFVYNGEKLYSTQVGSHMDIDERERGFTLLPPPDDVTDCTYRLYPTAKINGIEGYPIEVFGLYEDKKTRRIYTIEPKTYRLLRVEFPGEKGTIQMTVTKEEFNVPLKPNTFLPVLPGKIIAKPNKNTLASSGVPFHLDFFTRTAAKK